MSNSTSQSYCEHFKLDSGTGWDGQPGRFRMNTRVVRIDKHPNGGHIVTLQRKEGSMSRFDSGVDLPSTSVAEEPSSEHSSTEIFCLPCRATDKSMIHHVQLLRFTQMLSRFAVDCMSPQVGPTCQALRKFPKFCTVVHTKAENSLSISVS